MALQMGLDKKSNRAKVAKELEKAKAKETERFSEIKKEMT